MHNLREWEFPKNLLMKRKRNWKRKKPKLLLSPRNDRRRVDPTELLPWEDPRHETRITTAGEEDLPQVGKAVALGDR